MEPTPVLFHDIQLAFKPLYEWAFGEKIPHPETTARAESIRNALLSDESMFQLRRPQVVPLEQIRELHSYQLMTLYNTAALLDPEVTFYPSVFPKSEQARPDPTNIQHAGCFCFDSGTPLNAMTLEAASWSAACAVEAANGLLNGDAPLVYALSRPPGHHATQELFGGYCYFNNVALAARELRRHGRVALVDIDFHHGNGTQRCFYFDSRVLVISIHGDPREFYPYFAGHADECGAGPGVGFNLNLPLPGGCDGPGYMEVIDSHVLPTIKNFGPDFLVISAGHDAYVRDPVGHFALEQDDFITLGERLGRLGYPTLVVQEGGYHTAHLGTLVSKFLQGARAGVEASPPG